MLLHEDDDEGEGEGGDAGNAIADAPMRRTERMAVRRTRSAMMG